MLNCISPNMFMMIVASSMADVDITSFLLSFAEAYRASLSILFAKLLYIIICSSR